MEGAGIREHGGVHALSLQDREKVFRRGHRGDAGGGRHHILAHRERVHHQQLRLQDTP